MHTWSPSYDFTCACIIIIPLIELPHLLPVAVLPPQILSQVFLFFSHSMPSALQHSIPLLSSSSLGRIVDVHLYKLISISSKPWFSLSAQRIDRHNAREKEAWRNQSQFAVKVRKKLAWSLIKSAARRSVEKTVCDRSPEETGGGGGSVSIEKAQCFLSYIKLKQRMHPILNLPLQPTPNVFPPPLKCLKCAAQSN